MHIAIVGAGLAGLACARGLVERGHAVTVFERGDTVGGRVGTMRTEVGGFDHGAQYFTARHPAFVAQAERWHADGIVARWDVDVHAIATPARPRAAAASGGASAGSAGKAERWVGSPGMSAIATRVADGLPVRFGAAIVAIDPRDDGGSTPRWSVRRDVAGSGSATVADGSFDAVVVATPPAIAAPLLAGMPALATAAHGACIEPCWALMLAFAEPIAADFQRVGDAAFVGTGRLAWIARESSKPERRAGERWTVHAQSAWSIEHFDDDPEDVKAKLLTGFHDATATIEQPVYATVYRWRHALARTSLASDFLWDAERRIGACGDWCRGYRVEDAWLSGTFLAGRVGDDLR